MTNDLPAKYTGTVGRGSTKTLVRWNTIEPPVITEHELTGMRLVLQDQSVDIKDSNLAKHMLLASELIRVPQLGEQFWVF